MKKQDEIKQYLIENPGESYRSVAKLFKTSHSFVGRIDKALRAKLIDVKPDATPGDLKEYWDKYKDLAKQSEKLDRKQTTAHIELKDDQPIGIAFSGDWHLGAHGLDVEQFEADMHLLSETRGLYVVGLGDYKDNQNAFRHPTGCQEQDFPSNVQDAMVKYWVEYILPLVLVRGCHDDWDKQLSSRDFIEFLCQDLKPKPFNLWHGGTINIKVGTQNYLIRARHKIPNESNLNTENAFRRWYDRNGKADILAAAHKHDPFVKTMYRQGDWVTYIRSGSYKRYDEFGQKLAGYEGKHACPVTVLFPDEHRVVAFQQLRDGIAFLKGVRK